MIPRNILNICALSIVLSSCGTHPIQPSSQHIQQPANSAATIDSIPQPIKNSVALPPPKPVTKLETYSVVVTNVSAQEILFALARDAKVNLDIQPGIEGAVTINAINQTLPQILTRIAKQVDMRYELDNGTLIVMPDSPYLHSYKIDYVNMARDADGKLSNTTYVGSLLTGEDKNSSSLIIKNSSKNHFWETLTQNIKDILRETDKVFPEGSSETLTEKSSNKTGVSAAKSKSKKSTTKNSTNTLDALLNVLDPNLNSAAEEDSTVTRHSTFREAASVIANPENGIITVRATGKQHEKIQEFIDKIMVSAQRQVLIEATIVEVQLSDNYQQGIDWSKFRTGSKGFNVQQIGTAGLPAANTGSMFKLGYLNPTSMLGNLAANISLLESFGKVKVLSSPKLSVMNNQTAMLRVVENNVYFTVNSTITPCSPAPCSALIAYTTTVNTVPIGFTMSVTPQINDTDSVLLNVRPSITRLIKNASDPTPGLSVANFVPQTSTREMESMLKIENNQIAVLGGMMEDRVNKATDEVPFLAGVPILGNLFQNRNDTTTKTELVIFLRPVVLKDANVNGDFSSFRDSLPDQNFFKEPANNLLQNQ
jgi:MSHA biogenesis protein MshL